MTTILDLKKGDIVYGFCIRTQALEVYEIDEITQTEIQFHTIIGEDSSFHLMFPKEINLEEAILCKYNDFSWWIYTVAFESIRNLIENDDWDWLADMYKIFYFDKYLDMWDQKVQKL